VWVAAAAVVVVLVTLAGQQEHRPLLLVEVVKEQHLAPLNAAGELLVSGQHWRKYRKLYNMAFDCCCVYFFFVGCFECVCKREINLIIYYTNTRELEKTKQLPFYLPTGTASVTLKNATSSDGDTAA
jgi:hypothetical protein